MKIRRIILIVVIVIILVLWAGSTFLNAGMDELQNIQLEKQDLNDKADGDYYGQCTIGRWKNELVLTIKDNKITDIRVIKDQTGGGEEVRDQIFNAVLAEQRVPVDAVAGATVTSNGYLQAMVDALQGGPQ